MTDTGEVDGEPQVARVSTRVAVEVAVAFELFTEQIDRWWLRGPKFRVSGRHPGTMTLECRVGGRLYEVFRTPSEPRVIETGRVLVFEPPHRLVLEWWAVNFAPSERTEVEVTFEPCPSGTLVTVTHRGWERLRSDHPARHGLAPRPFLRTMGLWWGELMTSFREDAAERAS